MRIKALLNAGVDFIAKDLSFPSTQSDLHIFELNHSPGLRMHIYPAEGKARDVAALILDYLFSASGEMVERCFN